MSRVSSTDGRVAASLFRETFTLEPETLAVMHGSSYIGKSGKLLTDLAGVIKESFDGPNKIAPAHVATR